MDQLSQHPWVQIIVAWGSGPLLLGLVGVWQWWRDRKDRIAREAFEQKREQRGDADSRDAALDESFHRLSKDQQDLIMNLRQDRDAAWKRCNDLEVENRKVHERLWEIILWGRDMRHAANSARMVANMQAVRLGDAAQVWPELPEYKS